MEHVDVEGIPVVLQEPVGVPIGVALWLTHLGGSTDQTLPMLGRLTAAGFVAVSFDPPGHGRRGSADPWQIVTATLGSFRQRMWPLLGQTTLEGLRVLDWVLRRFSVPDRCVAGGVSMGGDVAVALAGIDRRIQRACALVATPEWSRPHMHPLDDPTGLLDQGVADAYAQWYYDALNPMSHLFGYDREVDILFVSGGRDHHVPADDALDFRKALIARNPDAAGRIRVEVKPAASHVDVDDGFYQQALDWFTRD
jgi:dienelactone hydrolase